MSNTNKLKNYALWYYERYLPSVKALREKLLRKCESDEKLVETILSEIKDIFIEESLLDAKVRFLIDSHKNEKYIRLTLQKKGFEPTMIEERLEQYSEELNCWELHQQAISKKWQEMAKSGKSTKHIIQTLSQKFPHFKHEIAQMRQISDDDELTNLHTLYKKICTKIPPNSYENRQKIAAKLMQRGFEYSAIKRLFE